jgi:Protein of unknown function (DUF3703)
MLMLPFSDAQRHRVTQRLLQQAATQHSPTLRWQYLSAAHIAGQMQFGLHMQTHWAMLRAALAQANTREVLGQIFRLALVPLGHALGRLPMGNTGRANVSAFAPMDLAPDLLALIEQACKN